MTVREIQDFVASIDPLARHHFCTEEGDFTRWEEIELLPYMGDDEHIEAWRFQIDRFTRSEDDPIAAAFRAALETSHRIAFGYRRTFEPDTGYIHHIFFCEGA